MNPAGTIRTAAAGDAAEIARLSGELGYPATAEEVAARLARLLPSPTHLVVVAETSGRLAGWIAAERRLLLEYGERAEIVGLVVGEEARRNGVGRALVSEVERWAAAEGLAVVTVRSNVVRAESHPFYESLGYARGKTQHVYAKQVTPRRRPHSVGTSGAEGPRDGRR